MNIICISGKAEHGKTTTAKVLKTILSDSGYRVLITNYAGVLKFICTAFFDWDGNKNEEGRALLQRVGTDVVRKQDPDFWVNFMKSVLKLFDGEWDYVLIDDVRFPNEIEGLMDDFNVISLRVERPRYENHLTDEQRQHESEVALDDYNFTYHLFNPGDITIRTVAMDFANWLLGRE